MYRRFIVILALALSVSGCETRGAGDTKREW